MDALVKYSFKGWMIPTGGVMSELETKDPTVFQLPRPGGSSHGFRMVNLQE